MIVELGGGNDGIRQYLETGQKAGRELTRDQLDQRLVLSGDLAVTDGIIQSIKSDGERYDHITLAFKEDQISEEVLAEISADLKGFISEAYGPGEVDFYAEAHLPKVKSHTDSNGEVIRRLPHIHVVIPKINLVTGQRISVFEMLKVKYGTSDSTLSIIDAWQERINAKHGLASPKDNLRTDFSSETEVLSRIKGDDFKKKDVATRQAILNAMIDRGIETKDGFQKMLAEIGAVTVGRAGKPDAYFEVRLPSAPGEPENKKIRLKDHCFTPSYIAMPTAAKREALIRGRNAVALDPVEQDRLLDVWKTRRAREIKYIPMGSKLYKTTYSKASDAEKLAILDREEAAHYAKLERIYGYQKETGQIDALKMAQSEPEEYQAYTLEVPRYTSERLNRGFLRTIDELQAAMVSGDAIIDNPAQAIADLTEHQSSFTPADLQRYVANSTADDEQYDAAMASILQSDALVTRADEAGKSFTSKEIQALEAAMIVRVESMASKKSQPLIQGPIDYGSMNSGQISAFDLIVSGHQITAVNGPAGTGKSFVLAVANKSVVSQGYETWGATLQGKTAEELERDSGIPSRTMHSFLEALRTGEIRLHAKSIVFVDEAGMTGSKQNAELLQYVEAADSRLCLIGDAKQIGAVDFGAAYQAISSRVPSASLTEIMRQKEPWMRSASESLSRHEMAPAIEAYSTAGKVIQSETQSDAQAAIVDKWRSLRRDHPADSLLVVVSTNAERFSLNQSMRAERIADGELQGGQIVHTKSGARLEMAPGEQIAFTRNDRALGVKNGTTGIVDAIDDKTMTVKLHDGRKVSLPTTDASIDHGYAVTTNKSQGMTLDRCLVLVNANTKAENLYVAMTRHRTDVEVHYSKEVFATEKDLIKSVQKTARAEFTADHEWTAMRQNDGVVAQIIAERGAAKVIEKAAQSARSQEINAGLSAQRLLDYVSKSHGVDVTKYEITLAKDGGDRIKAGTRSYSVSDFLTKELHLDYKSEAAQILKTAYAEQLARVYSTSLYARSQSPVPRDRELQADFSAYRKEQLADYKTQAGTVDAAKIAARGAISRSLEQALATEKDLVPVRRSRIAEIKRDSAFALKTEMAIFKEAKADLADRYKKPATKMYADFIGLRAESGSQKALDEMRRMALTDTDRQRILEIQAHLTASMKMVPTPAASQRAEMRARRDAEALEDQALVARGDAASKRIEKETADKIAQAAKEAVPVKRRSFAVDEAEKQASIEKSKKNATPLTPDQAALVERSKGPKAPAYTKEEHAEFFAKMKANDIVYGAEEAKKKQSKGRSHKLR